MTALPRVLAADLTPGARVLATLTGRPPLSDAGTALTIGRVYPMPAAPEDHQGARVLIEWAPGGYTRAAADWAYPVAPAGAPDGGYERPGQLARGVILAGWLPWLYPGERLVTTPAGRPTRSLDGVVRTVATAYPVPYGRTTGVRVEWLEGGHTDAPAYRSWAVAPPWTRAPSAAATREDVQCECWTCSDTPADAFTHPSVLKGIAAGASWADPTMDPMTIDWEARQAAAAVPFEVVAGRPVIPGGPGSTAVRYGRNQLGHWGEQRCADALVLTTAPLDGLYRSGRRWLLMVERADGLGWAMPGGHVDAGETAADAAVRELAEETGLTLPGASWTPSPPMVVPDPRASDEAWMVTTVARADLAVASGLLLPVVRGMDDARRAAWWPAGSYVELRDALADHGGVVFAAHRGLLRHHLDAAGNPRQAAP